MNAQFHGWLFPAKLIGRLIAPVLIASASLEWTARSTVLAQNVLQPGDIVYADSGNAIDGGFIIKVGATTGEQVVLSSGGLLVQPFDLAVDQSGGLIVSDTSGRLIRIAPDTGAQVLLADNSNAPLGIPCGITLDSNDAVLVANTQAILRVTPASGLVQVVAVGGKIGTPIAVARTDSGDLFVL